MYKSQSKSPVSASIFSANLPSLSLSNSRNAQALSGIIVGLSMTMPAMAGQPAIILSSSVTASLVASTPTTEPKLNAGTAKIASTVSPNPQITQSQRQIDQIIYGNQFSKAIPQTRWEKIEPEKKQKDDFWQRLMDKLFKNRNSENRDNSGVVFGTIIKVIVLMALFAFIAWLLLQHEKWLPWFRRHATWYRPRAKATLSELEQPVQIPLWQNLPAHQQLVAAVEQALAAQDWLQALSLLYRGTLREVIHIHDLPITRATTEQQCEWLLAQAKHRQADEASYFKALVSLWSQVAYGKLQVSTEAAPAFRQQIIELLNTWQRLYANTKPRRITHDDNQSGSHTAQGSLATINKAGLT